MARIGKIPKMAAAAVATPEDDTFVLMFINTSDANKLSVKNAAGTVTGVALS